MSIAHDDRYYRQNVYASPSTTWEAAPVDQRQRGLWWLLFSFESRTPRRAYWLATLLSYFGYLFIEICFAKLHEGREPTLPMSVAKLGIAGLYLWISLATRVKRWHDRDKSGLWVLINLVPIVGVFWELIELGFAPGTPGRNTFGDEYDLDDLA